MVHLAVCSRDSKISIILAAALGQEFHLTVNENEVQIKKLVSQDHCDVLILDLDSDNVFVKKQITLFEEVVESPVPIVVLADDSIREKALDLTQRGAFGYHRKPPALRELRAIIKRACEQKNLKRELADTRKQARAVPRCDRLIGSGAEMLRIYDMIHRVANLDASVLVTGESGSGKELVAGAIHNLGKRANRPFVAVSCGAIPETLIESELFGHEKGAFTGTVGAREGYFEKVADGTLFLDEIGELSLQTQVKLLRVLQQREFSRLGSGRVIPLRARIVFATHRDLPEMVERGAFRRDLFYRINVVKIDCPSLEEHPEDVPLLAHHFLVHYSEQYGKPIEGIEPDALRLLETYSWPGNVRELENVIQRAIVMAEADSLRVADLPEFLRETGVVSIGDYAPAGSFERLIRDYKIKLATNAIQECNGNKTLAARNLNISRAYLHRLVRMSEQMARAAV